jgi:uncharacterized membrane protein YadS
MPAVHPGGPKSISEAWFAYAAEQYCGLDKTQAQIRTLHADTAMSTVMTEAAPARTAGFWKTDDAWAVCIGLALVALAGLLFAGGSSLAWLAVTPPKWTRFGQLAAHFVAAAPRYAAQFALWLVLVSGALAALGYRLRRTVPAFALIYALSVVIFAAGQWASAVTYNLEPPLLALAAGLVITNLGLLPRSLDEGFRVEFYIKLGVVLLGATLPFSLLIWAGPVALLQASIVSVVTFGVIFAAARLLGLDPRLASVLGVGGAVCGVSAAIAIAAAVGARRQDAAVVISIVILWAIVMIFALPFAAAGLGLPAGVGGAWIGTSEFADAAGFAAAQAYGGIAAHLPGAPAGAAEQSVAAFTLMKVVGRDVWIGLWALILSVVATLRWEETGITHRAGAGEIWRRFPKFVIGFLLASIAVTLIAQGVGHAAFVKSATPAVVAPLKNLRSWAFAFGFLCIGLTTRVRDLAGIGLRPMAAFSAGVVVNVLLGLALSATVFGAYWAHLGQ